MNMNTRQGGWIANFLIIGAVLVLGLVGTVYLVKSQSMGDDLAKIDNEQSQTGTTEESATADKNENSEKTDDSKKTEKANPTKEPADGSVTSDEPVAANTNENSEEESAETEELPATGPAEAASSLFALGLIAFSAVSYVRSRSA